MKKYRKKPVVIEAAQLSHENAAALATWANAPAVFFLANGDPFVEIPTIDGTMRAQLGDWIIKGVKGEFYPCKSDIFEMLYDEDVP